MEEPVPENLACVGCPGAVGLDTGSPVIPAAYPPVCGLGRVEPIKLILDNFTIDLLTTVVILEASVVFIGFITCATCCSIAAGPWQ